MSPRAAAPGPRCPRAVRRLAVCLAAVLLAAVLLAAPCATAPRPAAPREDVVVLLPDDAGKTGAVVVSAGGTERLLSEPGQAVTVAPGAPPGTPYVMSDDEVRALAGPALEALPRPPARFVLYFDNDSTELTASSRATLREVVRAVKERRSPDISVVGHTDTVGSKGHNDRLSLRRARTVAALLAAKGARRSAMEIVSHGKSNLLVPTGDQVPEPRNRCVEVTVR